MKCLLTAAAVALTALTAPTLAFADADDNGRRGRQERKADKDDRKQERNASGERFKDGRRSERPYVDVQPRRWSRGQVLPSELRRGVVQDPYRYGLYAPPRGHAWIHVGNDVYLTSLANGYVVEVVRDSFY
jgi:Ni/Co efflux regulator RcnB